MDLSIKARHYIRIFGTHYTIYTKYKSPGTYSTKPRNTPTKYNLEYRFTSSKVHTFEQIVFPR